MVPFLFIGFYYAEAAQLPHCLNLPPSSALRECRVQIKDSPTVFIGSLSRNIDRNLRGAYYDKECPNGGCVISMELMYSKLRAVNQVELVSMITEFCGNEES